MTLRKGVRKIFDEVAWTYEITNHLLTLGLDIKWRKQAAKKASSVQPQKCLDVCSGTGETAQLLSWYTDNDSRIISLDFSNPMVSIGKKKRKMKKIHFVLGDAVYLPFQDNVFDVMTITFATRNISPNKEILEIHLREFFRVLKPGGLFVNLETSQPSYRILKILFHLYVRLAVRSIGPLISKSKVGYKYLAHTVPRFFDPKELAELVRKAGFNEINFTPLFFGVAAIHTAKK